MKEPNYIQFYLGELKSRIAAHEAQEKKNPALMESLRAEQRRAALRIAGLPKKAAVKFRDAGYRHSDGSVTIEREEKDIGITHTIHIDAEKNQLLADIGKRIADLRESQKRGCVECDQLRALIDTKGVNGFTSFLRSRYGKDLSVGNTKAALPDWIKLRAPAACPVL